MFYAPELLKYKNKTELALLYYCSTSRKSPSKREVMALDIAIAIRQIMNPIKPFALRLNTYLFKGLVTVWRLKMAHYRREIDLMDKTYKSSNETKYLHKNSNKPSLVMGSCRNKNIAIFNKTFSHITEFNTTEFLEELSDVSTNFMDKFPNISTNRDVGGDFLLNGENTVEFLGDVSKNGIKRSKIDKFTTLREIKPYSFPNRAIVDSIPIGECFILNKFIKLIEAEKRLHLKTESSSLVRNESSLIRSENSPLVRNETSLLDFEMHEERLSEIEEIPTGCDWFYEILVQASLGRIRVFQEEPFKEIRILELE